jgi:hypothetical protein
MPQIQRQQVTETQTQYQLNTLFLAKKTKNATQPTPAPTNETQDAPPSTSETPVHMRTTITSSPDMNFTSQLSFQTAALATPNTLRDTASSTPVSHLQSLFNESNYFNINPNSTMYLNFT